MKYKLIYKCIVGSQAYGTNVEGSDVDIKGVYIQDEMEILTFGYKPQIELNKDETYYEVRRFIELLGSANPTVLEMLYSPEECILGSEPEWDILLQYRDEFVTKKCKHSFGGYAVQQIKKARGLNKKMNWDKREMVRKTPLDFCYVLWDAGTITLKDYLTKREMTQERCGLVAVDHAKDMYALYYSETIPYKGVCGGESTSLRLSSIPKDEPFQCWVSYNQNGYEQHCREYKEYTTWLKERNTQRYVDIENHGQQIDGKNMLHCRRLIDTAIDIATGKGLVVRRENTKDLIAIRKGEVKLETILDEAERDLKFMDAAYETAELPAEMEPQRVQSILQEIREYGKRTHQAPIGAVLREPSR